MTKLKVNKITVLFLLFISILFFGCQDPATKKAENKALLMENMLQLLNNNNPQGALDILYSKGEEYNQDIDILILTANAYKELNDPLTSSAILLNAYELEKENPELIKAYFQSLKAANLDTNFLLISIAEYSPDSLSQNQWLSVSQEYEKQNNFKSALNSLFKFLGSKSPSNKIPANLAYKISTYYDKIGNEEESFKWLNTVANSDSIEALTANFELLALELSSKDWSALNIRIQQIESRFPKALESSIYSDLPEIINTNLNDNLSNKALDLASESSDSFYSKSGGIQDIKDLNAFANKEAVYNTSNEPSVYDPSISIEPADPFIFDNTLTSKIPEEANSSNQASNEELNSFEIESLIEQANQAVLSKKFDTAAELYRKIIANNPNRSPIWNQLAQVYFANKEYSNAESSALEAIRNQPNNIAYTINYLNIAKETKSSVRFLTELSRASQQFPNSPEIALSLARAYDRNSRYRFKAKDYYIKFITLAPNHPQRSEAEKAIERLP